MSRNHSRIYVLYRILDGRGGNSSKIVQSCPPIFSRRRLAIPEAGISTMS
jgi:hypothetical protein